MLTPLQILHRAKGGYYLSGDVLEALSEAGKGNPDGTLKTIAYLKRAVGTSNLGKYVKNHDRDSQGRMFVAAINLAQADASSPQP